MKICSKCKEEKELNEFGNNKSKKDGLNNLCKICTRVNSSNYYLNLKDKTKIKNSWKKSYLKKQEFLFSFKDKLKCEKCGYDEYKCALDFHHLDPLKKEFGIGNVTTSKFVNKIEEEIQKCIPLCANCHRVFHYRQKSEGITIEKYLNK